MSYGMKTFHNGASFGRSDIPMPEGDTFFQGVLDAITAGWRVCSYFGVPDAAGATLASLLPTIIDRLTPNGQLPSTNQQLPGLDVLSQLLK